MHKERTIFKRKEDAFAALKIAVLPLILVACMVFGAVWIYGEASTQYTWQWARVWRYVGTFQTDNFFGTFKAGLLLKGAWHHFTHSSVRSCFYSSFCPVSGIYETLSVASVHCGQFRNYFRYPQHPLLIQLFLWYFVFAGIFGLTPFATAVLCLALFEGVYLAEILRSGIIAVSHTQWEASFSLGMTLPKTLVYVIMPQVFRNVLPSLAGQFISLIKDTSLVSAIAVADLTLQARNIISETYLSFEIWLITALFYFALTLFVSAPFWLLTKHFVKQYTK